MLHCTNFTFCSISSLSPLLFLLFSVPSPPTVAPPISTSIEQYNCNGKVYFCLFCFHHWFHHWLSHSRATLKARLDDKDNLTQLNWLVKEESPSDERDAKRERIRQNISLKVTQLSWIYLLHSAQSTCTSFDIFNLMLAPLHSALSGERGEEEVDDNCSLDPSIIGHGDACMSIHTGWLTTRSSLHSTS